MVMAMVIVMLSFSASREAEKLKLWLASQFLEKLRSRKFTAYQLLEKMRKYLASQLLEKLRN